jgi:hypothetical protein
MAQIISGDQVTLINQNGLITPAASPTHQTSPATWLVVLSGIAVADFTSVAGTEYTILIEPPVVDLVNRAVNDYGAPPPPAVQDNPFLNIEQLAPSAAVGSIYDPAIPVDQSATFGLGGFDIRAWVPNNPISVNDDVTKRTFNNVFTGMLVGITARDNGELDTITYRLPYSFTMLAQIVYSFLN